MTLELFTESRKMDPYGEPWKTLSTTLETRYRAAHSNTTSGAYRMFLTRCRKLQDIRDLGLQYIIFFPKLATWAERLTSKGWTQWKTEPGLQSVLSEVDKLVARHCPKWLDLLQQMYPRWDLERLPTPGQPLSRLQQGNRNDAQYDIPS